MKETCEVCGLTYADFRTNLKYKDVWEHFWSGDDDSRTWKNKRRSTVLGRWHEIKQKQWAEHLRECEAYSEIQNPQSYLPQFMESNNAVPF